MRRGHSAFWYYVLVYGVKPLLTVLTKRDWRGTEHIPSSGGTILATNHLSWSDPLTIGHFVVARGRWPVFLAKSELFDLPVVGKLMRGVGQIPVYRRTSNAGLALRDAEKGLVEGECVVFYPEGTCTRDPELWPMVAKTGVARLALSTGVPVVPLAHWGEHELLPYGEKMPRLLPRKTVRFVAGAPVDLSAYEGKDLTAETLRAATVDIMAAVTRLLAELRGERPPEQPYDWRAAAEEKDRGAA